MTTTKKNQTTKKKSKPDKKTRPATKRVRKPKHPNFNKLTADEIYDWAIEQSDPVDATSGLLGSKQEKFVQIILIEPYNYPQTYRNAGYTAKNDQVAWAAASRLLRNHKVQARIRILKKMVMDNVLRQAEDVIGGLWEIRDRCMQIKPVMEYVDREWVETGEYQFDSRGATAASNLLGQHYEQFTKKLKHDGLDFKITISKAYENDEEPGTDNSAD